jgi:molybdopterin-guanine dinucleotide biosynthesis protein A
MIEIVIDAVKGLGSELILITNNPQPYGYLKLPIFADIYPNRGPLGGIYTALTCAQNAHILIVACDMPMLNRALLDYMIELRDKAEVIVPRWGKYPEPLHAIYNKQCSGPIEEQIKAGQLKITGFFKDVSVRFVKRDEIEQFDKEGLSFSNVNTPDELKRIHKKTPPDRG